MSLTRRLSHWLIAGALAIMATVAGCQDSIELAFLFGAMAGWHGLIALESV